MQKYLLLRKSKFFSDNIAIFFKKRFYYNKSYQFIEGYLQSHWTLIQNAF